MKQAKNHPFSMSFLMERYAIRQQSLNEYVKNHLAELNADGEHAVKIGKAWQFDAEAIRILDKLRDFTDGSVAIYDYENPETVRANEAEAKLGEALKMIEGLRESNKRKDEALQSQARTLELQAVRLEKADNDALLLSAAEADLKIAEADKHRQQQQINSQAEEIARLRTDFEAERKARQDAEARAEAEAKKSWWDKLWGK